jgi:hypothetical protein
MSDADKYRGLHGLSHTPGPHQAKAEPSLADRLAAQRAAFARHKSTEGPGQFGRVTGQPAPLSIPTLIVREVIKDPDPQRALGTVLDDITAICRAMLRKEMEGRRE